MKDWNIRVAKDVKEVKEFFDVRNEVFGKEQKFLGKMIMMV